MRIKDNIFFIYLLNILAMSFWGFSFVWIKIVYKYYSPFTVLVFRLFISAFFLFFLAKIFFRKDKKIDKKDIPLLCLMAFFEPFLYFVGESLGLLYVSSTVASLLVATIPVFMVFASYIFLKEKINLKGISGLILSIFGIVFLILDKDLVLKYNVKGILLMFLAILAAIGFNITGSKLLKKYSPVTLIKWQNLLGAIYFIPLCIKYDLLTKGNLFNQPITFELVSNLLYLSIFASALSFLFYMTAVEKIGVSKANMFTYLIPMFTAIFAYIVLGEKFDLNKLYGMIFIISGIIVSSSKKKIDIRKLFIKRHS